MARIIKGRQMAARYWKGREVLKEYKQGRLVYEKSTSIPDYLCFTALESGTFTLTIPAAVTATYLSYIEWSKDGRTWTRLTVDDTAQSVTTPIIPVGGKVYWRGSGSRMAYDYSVNKYSVFSSTGTFDVSGDLRSLLFSDDFENVATTNQRYCFTGLFYGASVVNASNLRLALTGNSAYMYCFRGCTQLLHAPALMEGNTIMQWQFHSTYDGCTNLVTGTDLQATSVGVRGCYYTYKSCTSLVKAPNISSITTIGNGGLSAMFHGCSSLTYIKCLATSLYDDGDASHFATYNWVAGVSSTGTFIQAEGVEWPRGASGIPTGWVDVEKRTMPSGYKQVEYLLNPNLGAFNLQHVFDSANETIELQFVNTADGGMFLGTTNHGGYYGNISVGKSGTTNLSVRIGIGDTTVNTSIIGMTADAPMTFRYEGNANGFKFYTNGTLQKSYTGGWDVQHTITVMYVYSNTDGSTAPSTYPTWFGKCPFIGLKVWDGNSDIIIDFVPCIRESDGLAGFYDFARTTFYYSLNGNDFAAGEEI